MPLETIHHQVDFCVVGGGLAGICAAVSAARHGLKVALMQDRPVLGGNASSEVRMWVCGAHGRDNRETGILEEIMMENQYRNPDKNYYIWDSILYEKVRFEENITLLLNCSCLDASMENGCLKTVTGWQTTTQRYHCVEAPLFSDCSGDSILAPLTGASFRMGREAQAEFQESIEPAQPDAYTMGLSCLIQAEETETAQPYIPPAWAEKVTRQHLPHRQPDLKKPTENFWYLELGGTRDAIADTEEIRDELIPLAFGLWDYIKNDPAQKEKNENWRLSWVGYLPGKRESRRYDGAYVLNQRDVQSGGNFSDEIAYGGWSIDDHNPHGFRSAEPPTTYHPAPSPYGIPFRSLYSKDVPNLFFAGRNISVSHAALSTTRVMGTCALLGQAVGTAASIAVKRNCLPKDISERYITELQDLLMDDDCYLPHLKRSIDSMCVNATLSGDGTGLECLRDGTDRNRPEADHAWHGRVGDQVVYTFETPQEIRRIRLVFDSDLNRDTLPESERRVNRNMFHNHPKSQEPSYVPKTMLRAFQVIACHADGSQSVVLEETNQYHRLYVRRVRIANCVKLIFKPLKTWGSQEVNVFAFEASAR